MSDFHDVPEADIDYLIETYNLEQSGDKHTTVWNFLINNDIPLPASIEDFVIAFNNNTLATYKISQLLNNNIVIDGITDMSRIIRILKYANKLEEDFYFIMLPDDVLFEILSKLDYETIMEFCKLSKRTKSFCTNNLLKTLRISLQNSTGFNTYNFTMEQLHRLHQNRKMQKRISGNYVLNHNNQLCKLITQECFDWNLDIIKIVSYNDIIILLTRNGKVYIINPNDEIISASSLIPYGDISQIANINNAIDVIIDNHTILVLLDDGNVLGFGNNKYKDMPNMPIGMVTIPTLVPEIGNVRYMERILNNLYFITNNNKIHEIYNEEDDEPISLVEQLEKVGNIIKMKEWGFDVIVLNSEGEVYKVEDDKFTKIKDNIIDISQSENFGFERVLMLDRDGNVYVYGDFSKEIYELYIDKDVEYSSSFIGRVSIDNPAKLETFKDISYINNGQNAIFLVDKEHKLYMNYIDENGAYARNSMVIRQHPTIKL